MTIDSEVIVRGHIVSIEKATGTLWSARWDRVKFAVDEVLKGSASGDFEFSAPSSANDDISSWVRNRAPLLVFLTESRRFSDRQASRCRYALRSGRWRQDVLELRTGAGPQAATAAGSAVSGAESILSTAKAIIAATKIGCYIPVPAEHSGPIPDRQRAGAIATLVVPEFKGPDAAAPEGLPCRLVESIDFDGDRIFAARGKGAYVWDARTGREIGRMVGNDEKVTAVAFASKNEGYLTASLSPGSDAKDHPIRLWRDFSGKNEVIGHTGGPVNKLCPRPHHTQFLGESSEGIGEEWVRTRLFETFDRQDLFVFPGTDARFSADGTLVASMYPQFGAFDSWFAVWDADTRLQLYTVQGGDISGKRFKSMSFSPYGNKLVTTSTEATDVWDAETGKRLFTLEKDKAHDAQYTRDGLHIVTGSSDGILGVWSARTGVRERSIKCPKMVHEILVSPNGMRCVVTWGPGMMLGRAEGASLFDLSDGKELLRFKNPTDLVGFSTDGKTFLTLTQSDLATIWSSDTGKALRTLQLKQS